MTDVVSRKKVMLVDAHLHVADLRDVPTHVVSARRAGVNGLWTMEGDLDAYLQLAAATPSAGGMQLGTSVALAFNRSPMVTAYAAWMLSRSTEGRFVLGLGPQVAAHNRRRFSVPADHPRDRMVEAIRAIRVIWAHWQEGRPLDFRGQYYSFNLMTPAVNPGPIEHPDIPILMAAVGPVMAEAAGTYANGIVLHPLHSREYLEMVTIPHLRTGISKSEIGRRPLITAQVFVATGRTAAEVARSRERIRAHLAFFASTKAYRGVLERHGWAEVSDELRVRAREQRWSTMSALVSDAMLETFAVSGAPEEIRDRLQDRYAGLVDRVTVYDPYRLSDEQVWTRLLRGRPN